jgi:hypothetical protein
MALRMTRFEAIPTVTFCRVPNRFPKRLPIDDDVVPAPMHRPNPGPWRYRNPAALILDEPTSALDGVNVRGLEDNLDAILPGRTTVLIAHRLSTLRKAHRVLVLQQGRLAEQGKHEELLASSSLYRGLIGDSSI